MTADDSTPIRDPAVIDRRSYLKAAGGFAAAGATGIAGCTDGGSDAGPSDGGDADTDGGSDGTADSTGVLATSVTDQPTDIGDFESCVVTLDGVWLGPRRDAAGDEEETEGEEADGNERDSDETDDETADDEEESSDGDDGDETGDDGDDETQDGSDQTTNETTSGSSVAGSQPEDAGQNRSDGRADEDDGDDEEEGDGDDEEDDRDDEEAEDDDEAEEDGNGRTYYAFDEPQEADLVELQGENTQLVDDREVPVGTYQFLQLDVAGVEGVLVDGGEAVVDTPGNAPLKFQESFDVREGYRTSFTADFAPVRRGNGEYLIKPVATGTEVSYVPIDGEEESDDDTDSTDDETSEDGDESADDGEDTSDDETTDDGSDTTDDGGASNGTSTDEE